SGSKRKDEYEIAPTNDPKEAVCFYCNTKGHWKRSCPKYLKDLKDEKVKKGSHSGMFMIELHNTTTSDSWVMDTGCGTYICTVFQGLKERRRLKHGELNLIMGNRKITPVTRIGMFELMLKSGIRINLNNCCYSSEMTRNIIPFYALFKDGYQFSFDNENGDILVYVNGSSNELDKSKLWHSRLGHINKKRIAQLQKDGSSAVALDGTLCLVDQDRLGPIIVDDLSKWENVGFHGNLQVTKFDVRFIRNEDIPPSTTTTPTDLPAKAYELMIITFDLLELLSMKVVFGTGKGGVIVWRQASSREQRGGRGWLVGARPPQ
nr:hypothetical protein [Tanacetum cinerariifolium]